MVLDTAPGYVTLSGKYDVVTEYHSEIISLLCMYPIQSNIFMIYISSCHTKPVRSDGCISL